MSSTEQIADAIDARLAAAREEIRQLESARTALRGIQRPAPAGQSMRRATRSAGVGATREAPTVRRRSRGRSARRSAARPTKAVSPEQIEAMLSPASDGLRAAEIADQIGTEHHRVLGVLRELEAAGRVRRSGERRTTRWYPVTDEDRIAQRAAELAARG